MTAVLDWLKDHKALIGTILVAGGGLLSGTLDLTAAIAAVLAAFSAGVNPKPAPAPVVNGFEPYRHDAA